MIFRAIICAAVLLGGNFGPLAAQSLAQNGILDPQVAADPSVDVAPDVDVAAAVLPGVDLAAWRIFENTAGGIVETGTASQFALTRIRAELVIWRDQFFSALDINKARLATVSKQITALAPAEGTELADPVLLDRMDQLAQERDRLRRPLVLANEAFVNASGLIAEVDAQSRIREAVRLSTRSASPANPVYWPDAWQAVTGAMSVVIRETTALSGRSWVGGHFWSRLAMVVIGTVAALFFVLRIRAWIASLKARPMAATHRRAFAVRFILSLGSVVLPIVGLLLLGLILRFSGFVGLTGTELIASLPVFGGLIFVAKWLCDWYFPTHADDDGILGYDQATRIKARRMVVLLSWALALREVVSVLLVSTSASVLAVEVAGFPFQIVLGVLLWRLGALIVRLARPDSDAIFKRNRVRKFIGHLAQAFAVLGPVASTLGFAAAAQSITGPAVISLALFATVVVFQRLSYAMTSPDVSSQKTMVEPDDGPLGEVTSGLLPIAINTGLFALSLPVLALLWGATPANLIEVWTRFRAGFSIGDVSISPSTFVTFVVVLVLGYLLTGAIKTSLRTTVLPRTSLDIGGKNAVVAGTGYVGIILSALAAFTIAGINLSSLAIVAGALSVGIGFGLQNIVQNFVAGIILLIERPVSEGDMIEVGGQMGYVRDISVRSTRIETFDRTDVIVPNADLISSQVTNWTRGNSVGRSIVTVGVAYGSDFKRVTEILQAAAEANPMVLLNPPPAVLLVNIGASSFDYEIRAIIRDVNFLVVVKSEILHDIAARFHAEGIEMPFPQSDIWLRNAEALHQKGNEA